MQKHPHDCLGQGKGDQKEDHLEEEDSQEAEDSQEEDP